MTNEQSRPPRATYRFGHFVLNLTQGALFAADGSEVILRPKSFALLCFLVENAGRLLDRDTIMAAVWPGIYATDESLAQCIKDVRRALGPDGRQMVRTLPKRGYRFETEVAIHVAPVAATNEAPACQPDDEFNGRLAASHAEVSDERAQPKAAPTIMRPQPDPATRPDPRPSIAVLPFRQDTIAPDKGYFADGITEGIISVLAGLEALFVISRASTLRFRDTTMDLPALGRELGVRYILHGTLWRSDGRLRLAIELTDTETGAVLLTKIHDGEMADLFSLQDRISIDVAATIAPHVQRRELQRVLRKPPNNLTAYDLVLQALDQIHRLRRESFVEGRRLLQRAIEEDPDYATGYSYAAWWHILSIAQGWSANQEADSADAVRLAEAATERDQNDAMALAVQGYVIAYADRDYDTALHLLDRALIASPNCALACTFSSIVHSWRGDGLNAVVQGERGRRLSPLDPFAFLHENFLAMAYYINGDYDASIKWARSSAARNPRHAPTLRGLVVSLVAAGRCAEARQVARRILQIEPDFRLDTFLARTPLKGEIRDQYVARLRQAGLPD